nr:amidohydrolase [Chryseolinea sp.]
MKKKIQFLAIALAFVGFIAQAQSPKAKSGTFALTHANIETVTKGVITNGTIIIQKGKITAVGTNVTVPVDAIVIDCTGKWIYPGMIDGGTQVGLLEMGQIPQASDVREGGQIVPQMKALTAVNPSSAVIPVTRVSGVTTVITAPAGGMFPGTAALIS